MFGERPKWREAIPCPQCTGIVPLWTQPGVLFWMQIHQKSRFVSCPPSPSTCRVSCWLTTLNTSQITSSKTIIPCSSQTMKSHRCPCSPKWFQMNQVQELLNSPVNTWVRMGKWEGLTMQLTEFKFCICSCLKWNRDWKKRTTKTMKQVKLGGEKRENVQNTCSTQWGWIKCLPGSPQHPPLHYPTRDKANFWSDPNSTFLTPDFNWTQLLCWVLHFWHKLYFTAAQMQSYKPAYLYDGAALRTLFLLPLLPCRKRAAKPDSIPSFKVYHVNAN